MKRTIAIFSVFAMLLTVLCACGSESKNDTANGGTAAPNTQVENGTNGNGNANANAGGNANADGTQSGSSGDTNANNERSSRMGETVGDAVGGMIGGAAGAVEGALGGAADGMRGRTGPTKNAGSVGRFEQMVENGKVRDTDGFLADGENKSDNKIF